MASASPLCLQKLQNICGGEGSPDVEAGERAGFFMRSFDLGVPAPGALVKRGGGSITRFGEEGFLHAEAADLQQHSITVRLARFSGAWLDRERTSTEGGFTLTSFSPFGKSSPSVITLLSVGESPKQIARTASAKPM